jgi:penicillin-binding protein 2
MSHPTHKASEWQGKGILNWFRLGAYLIMAVFVSRLVFLTLVLGEHNEKMASGNRIRKERVEPLRGAILDRNGEYLAQNKRFEDPSTQGATEGWNRVVRHYPLGEIAAGVTGFVGEISENSLESCGDECFFGQMVGKSGLESWYEDELKGSWGLNLIEEDARGEKMRGLERDEAIGGKDLKLSLDARLQRQVYWIVKDVMEETQPELKPLDGQIVSVLEAAVVVSRVNGEVLSMVSLPSFDPNLFVKNGIRGEEGGYYTTALAVIEDWEKKPMFNRVIGGMYPPGSVYKLVMAVAGLEEKVIDGSTTVEDKGEIKVGEFRFGNWYFDQYGRTEGEVDIEKALARSNDIFFYKLGEWLGVDKMIKWSLELGVGEQTGIDLPGEASGFLPTPLWREKRTGERWFLGNTYHMSIGQGDLLVTPLQVSQWTASMFNGKVCKPRLGLGSKVECTDLRLDEKTKSLVQDGMRDVCMSGGTAFPFFDLDGKVYCKTGTAQHGGEETEPHAWITVVVPEGEDRNQWIVVTVLLPEAGEGSAVAGPVARKIVDHLLEDEVL